MSTYYIYMDQGLVVDLRYHTLTSGQFSSCAPIVFYNKNTHIGGLYHLGGCSTLTNMNSHNLKTIDNRVNSTVIYVLCGGGDVLLGMSRGHIDHVCSLFKNKTVHTSFHNRDDYSSITVSEVAGNLNIERCYSCGTNLKTKAEIDKLPDDVFFIGENDDEALAKWL